MLPAEYLWFDSSSDPAKHANPFLISNLHFRHFLAPRVQSILVLKLLDRLTQNPHREWESRLRFIFSVGLRAQQLFSLSWTVFSPKDRLEKAAAITGSLGRHPSSNALHATPC